MKNEERTTKPARLSSLVQYMHGYKLTYAGAIVAVAIATVAAYVVPLVVRLTIDSVIGDKPVDMPKFIATWITESVTTDHLRENLWIPALVILSVTLVAGVFQFFQKKWSSVASEQTAQRLRERLYDHLQHLSYDYHVKAETGDLIQRCTSDVETVRRFLAIQMVEVGRAGILLLTAYPLLFSLHVPLALLSVPIVVVIFIFSALFFKRVQTAFKKTDESEGRLSTVLQENLTGVRVVRAFARQKFEEDKFAERNAEFRGLARKLIGVFAVYWGTSDLLAMGHMMAILLAGTWYAIEGALSIGDIVVFLTVEGMLLWPVRQLGRILADMGKATVSLGRINEILDTPTEYPAVAGEQPKITGRVEFRDVRFSYEGDREILKGISFVAEPGKTVAILGPTGSGKSSLVHLLSRLYDYDSGSITVDGVELREIDKKWIRSHIGFVLQEPFLYAKTVKQNIGLARGADHDAGTDGVHAEAIDAEIYEAARDAAVHDVIESFEKGYETLVGERGVTLSGGQKQRVAIARALITGNPILVFDDSLSAVDTETDVAIRRALARRAKHATTFIISHRVTTLASADLILVLDDGQIVQAGTHEELMEREGLYRRVWAIQNSLEDEMQKELTHEPV
ncbi:MAG: ABC transporter ATP-binding protein [Spirochaetota bacterium]